MFVLTVYSYECYLEVEFQDLLYIRSRWKAAVLSHEVSQCKVSENGVIFYCLN